MTLEEFIEKLEDWLEHDGDDILVYNIISEVLQDAQRLELS